MNYTTAIFLRNDNVRAIKAIYETDLPNRPATRELFKTIDPKIKVDDFVIVESQSRHGMSVCKVVEIDSKIDLETTTQMKWVVSRIDDTVYNKVVAYEESIKDTVQNALAAKKKKELQAAMDEYAADLKPLVLTDSATASGK